MDAKWADGIKTKDELRQLLIDKGEKDELNKTFRRVSFHNYLATVKPKQSGDAVAVVVMEGSIIEGNAPAGQVGGRSTAELLRSEERRPLQIDPAAREFAGRQRHQVRNTSAANWNWRRSRASRSSFPWAMLRPPAATGCRWVRTRVIADPATITGSIGVYGMLPTGEKAMENSPSTPAGTPRPGCARTATTRAARWTRAS